LLNLAAYFRIMGAYDQAIAVAQRALALGIARGDGSLQAFANLRLGYIYHSQGHYRRAIDCFRQTMAALKGAQHDERFGQVYLPAVMARVFLAACPAELGTFAEGSVMGEEGLRMAEAAAHPVTFMLASWGGGLLALRRGDLPRALPLLERAVHICRDADLPAYFPRVAAALGEAYTLAGRAADAVPLLTQALEQATATKRVSDQALPGLCLGEALALDGRMEEAQSFAEGALTLARAHQEQGHEAYALRVLGDMAARREPPEIEPAEAHYQQALTLAEALGMRPLQAHCHRGLGTLYAKMDQREQARAELSTAIDLYRAMAMTFWLPEAERALTEVEGR
jgi:tetratricopeptide (TPR) repeat protein